MTDIAAVAPAFIEQEFTEELPRSAEVGKQLNRYLFYPNDTFHPKRKRKAKRLRWGGDELEGDYKCCGITHGVLWRNMFVPMTKGYEYADPALLTADQMQNATEVVRKSAPDSDEPQKRRTMYAIDRFPGDEIQTLLFGKSEWPLMGLTEIKALRGLEWADFKSQGIQTFFFPEWELYKTHQAEMPYPLSWTRQRINEAAKSTSDNTLKDIADDCLSAIEQTYTWGIEYLKRETKMVKTPPSGSGYVYGYSPLAEQLFDFLEQHRDDYLRSKDITPFATSDTSIDLKDTLDKIAQSQGMIAQILANQAKGQDTSIMEIPPEVKAEAEKMSEGLETVQGSIDTKPNLCQATKKDGESCGAPPLNGTQFCHWHTE